MMKFTEQVRQCHAESFAALKDQLREESARVTRDSERSEE